MVLNYPISAVVDKFRAELRGDFILQAALKSGVECDEYSRKRLVRIVTDVDKSSLAIDTVNVAYESLMAEDGRAGIRDLIKRIELILDVNSCHGYQQPPHNDYGDNYTEEEASAATESRLDLTSPLVADFRAELHDDYILTAALRSGAEWTKDTRDRLRRIVKTVDRSSSPLDTFDVAHEAVLVNGDSVRVSDFVQHIEFVLNAKAALETASTPQLPLYRRSRHVQYTVTPQNPDIHPPPLSPAPASSSQTSRLTEVRVPVAGKRESRPYSYQFTSPRPGPSRPTHPTPSLPAVAPQNPDIHPPPLSSPSTSSPQTSLLTEVRVPVAEKREFSSTSPRPHSYQPTAPRPGPSRPTYVTPSGRSQGIDWSSRPTVSTRFRDLVYSHKYLPTAIQERGKTRADKTVQQQFYNIVEQIDPSLLKDPIAMAIFRRGDISIVDLYLTLEDFLVNAIPNYKPPRGLFRRR